MRGLLVLFALVVGCTPAAAPRDGRTPADDAPCRTVLNRPADSHFGEGPTGKESAHPTAIAISPGEVLCVDAENVDGRLVDFHFVGPEHPRSRTLRIEASSDGSSSLLLIKNPGGQTLRYHAAMVVPERKELLSTSVCPVLSGIVAAEHWPHPIVGLILYDFTLVDTPGACE